MKSNIRELAALRAAVNPESALTRALRLIGDNQSSIDADSLIKAARETSLNLDGSESPQNMIALLAFAVESLTATINEARFGGERQGYQYAFVLWKDTSVRVEYESNPPDREHGEPGDFGICNVLINGQWIDPYEVTTDDQINDWSEEILSREKENCYAY